VITRCRYAVSWLRMRGCLSEVRRIRPPARSAGSSDMLDLRLKLTTGQRLARKPNQHDGYIQGGARNEAEHFLADRTCVTVELLAWLSSVCLSVRPSVTDVLWLSFRS